jgi:hypothetical protein
VPGIRASADLVEVVPGEKVEPRVVQIFTRCLSRTQVPTRTTDSDTFARTAPSLPFNVAENQKTGAADRSLGCSKWLHHAGPKQGVASAGPPFDGNYNTRRRAQVQSFSAESAVDTR